MVNRDLLSMKPFLESNLVGIAIFTLKDSTLIVANGYFIELFRVSTTNHENGFGQHVSSVIPGWEDGKIKQGWDDAVNTGQIVILREYLFKVFKPEGTYLNINIIPIYEDDCVNYLALNVVDVTNSVITRNIMCEKINEYSFRQSQIEKSLREKEDYVSYISHELRTPISVINAAVQTMELTCKNDMTDKVRKYIKQIKQNTLRQLRLINYLLEINKIENGYLKLNRKNTDIVMVIKTIVDSVSMFAKHIGVNIYFKSETANKILYIDEEKFERVMLNLLSNAVKFTPKGKNIYVDLSIQNNNTIVKVQDEGVGIPKDKLKVIFERFGQVSNAYTSSMEGIGIGLWVVKHFIEALGGEISVESEIGEGSTFMIVLPDKIKIDNRMVNTKPQIKNERILQFMEVEFSDLYS